MTAQFSLLTQKSCSSDGDDVGECQFGGAKNDLGARITFASNVAASRLRSRKEPAERRAKEQFGARGNFCLRDLLMHFSLMREIFGENFGPFLFHLVQIAAGSLFPFYVLSKV